MLRCARRFSTPLREDETQSTYVFAQLDTDLVREGYMLVSRKLLVTHLTSQVLVE